MLASQHLGPEVAQDPMANSQQPHPHGQKSWRAEVLAGARAASRPAREGGGRGRLQPLPPSRPPRKTGLMAGAGLWLCQPLACPCLGHISGSPLTLSTPPAALSPINWPCASRSLGEQMLLNSQSPLQFCLHALEMWLLIMKHQVSCEVRDSQREAQNSSMKKEWRRRQFYSPWSPK